RGVSRYEYVHARTEFHDAEALSRAYVVAAREPAHDAPRQHADDLPRDDRLASVIDPDLAPLVHASRVMTIRRQKSSRRHGHACHASRHGYSVDVDVHRRQKDADLFPRSWRRAVRDDIARDEHASVRRREDVVVRQRGWRDAVRIAKEEREERREHEQSDA